MPPLEVAASLRSLGGLMFLDTVGGGEFARSFVTAAPIQRLSGLIHQDWETVRECLEEKRGTAGGLFGWVGYDGRFTFGVYPHVMVFHHGNQQWSESGDLSSRLPSAAPLLAPPPSLLFRPLVSRGAFIQAVQRAQEYIAAGDIYQVNIAHPWQAAWRKEADALALYARLREISPAPYSAFAELDDTRVISSSLESFLHMSERTITTRPIKGTRPRFPHDTAKDQQS
ncbi:MAG: pabB, partial [Verrucomicrobiaceae bacterium]|nr:pabB [Verrucomicrobiaceae bacterium]